VRIRRRLSEHDQLTALAAERDQWRGIAEDLLEVRDMRDSQSDSRVIARDSQGNEIDVTEQARSRVSRGEPGSQSSWGDALWRVFVGLAILVTIGGSIAMAVNKITEENDAEEGRLLRMESDVSELHKYIRHLERKLEYTKRIVTTKAPAVGSDRNNSTYDTGQGQLSNGNAQMDVRARAGDRSVRCARGDGAARTRGVPGGVLSVCEDVLPELRESASTNEVP